MEDLKMKQKQVASILLILILIFTVSSMTLAAKDSSLLGAIKGNSSTDQIASDLDDKFSFILGTILPLIGGLLLGIAAVIFASGSQMGKSKLVYAIIGIGVLAFVPKIIGFMANWG